MFVHPMSVFQESLNLFKKKQTCLQMRSSNKLQIVGIFCYFHNNMKEKTKPKHHMSQAPLLLSHIQIHKIIRVSSSGANGTAFLGS